MVVELKGNVMTHRAAAHEHIKQQLNLPDYYGRNLDALFDLLTERSEPTEIVVLDWEEMEMNLGDYALGIYDTLVDAAEQNPALSVQARK